MQSKAYKHGLFDIYLYPKAQHQAYVVEQLKQNPQLPSDQFCHLLGYVNDEASKTIVMSQLAMIKTMDDLYQVLTFATNKNCFSKAELITIATQHRDKVKNAEHIERIIYRFPPSGRLQFLLLHINKIADSRHVGDLIVRIVKSLPVDQRTDVALRLGAVMNDFNTFLKVVRILQDDVDCVRFIEQHKNLIQTYGNLKDFLLNNPHRTQRTAEFALSFSHLINNAKDLQQVIYLLGQSEGIKFIEAFVRRIQDQKQFNNLIMNLPSIYRLWETDSKMPVAISDAILKGLDYKPRTLASTADSSLKSSELKKNNSEKEEQQTTVDKSVVAQQLTNLIPTEKMYSHAFSSLKDAVSLAGKVHEIIKPFCQVKEAPTTLAEVIMIFSKAASIVATHDVKPTTQHYLSPTFTYVAYAVNSFDIDLDLPLPAMSDRTTDAGMTNERLLDMLRDKWLQLLNRTFHYDSKTQRQWDAAFKEKSRVVRALPSIAENNIFAKEERGVVVLDEPLINTKKSPISVKSSF